VVRLQRVHKIEGSQWTCVHMKTTCTQTLHESELSFMYHASLP
jgi:hypothetical protein